MKAQIDPNALENALREAGGGWLIDFPDSNKTLQTILERLEQFSEEYESRFQEWPDPFQLLKENPSKGIAFFQIDTFRMSLDMRILVWRILLGCQIVRLDYRYDAGAPPKMEVELMTPHGESDPVYISQDPQDFRLFRHLGAIGVGTHVELQGYYASQVHA